MNYLAIASMMVAMCLLKLLLTIELWTNDPKHLNSLNEEFRPLIIFEDLSEFSSRTGNDVGSWFSIGAEILLLLCLSNIGVQWNVEGKHMEKLVLRGLKEFQNINLLAMLAKRQASPEGSLMDVCDPNLSWEFEKSYCQN